MPAGGRLPDQCTHCHQPLEIAAVSFPFLKPCRALFVCTSCGLTFAEGDQEGAHKDGRTKRFRISRYRVRKMRRRDLERGIYE
jgi:hypothetical protein